MHPGNTSLPDRSLGNLVKFEGNNFLKDTMVWDLLKKYNDLGNQFIQVTNEMVWGKIAYKYQATCDVIKQSESKLANIDF